MKSFTPMRSFKIKRNSFVYRMIALLFMIMILLYIVVSILIHTIVTDVSLSRTKDYLGTLLDERLAQLEGRLRSIAVQGKVLSTVLASQYMSPDTMDAYLQSLLHDNSDLISICIAPDPDVPSALKPQIYTINNTGQLIFNPLNPKNYEFNDWYQLAALSGIAQWGEPWFDDLGAHQFLCSYSIPLQKDGRKLGVLRLDTSVDQLKGIDLPVKIQEHGYTFLISDTGTIINHPADSLVMNYSMFNLADEYDDDELLAISKSMVGGNKGISKTGIKSYFQNQWICYAQLPSNRWSLAIVVSDDYVFLDRNTYLNLNFWVTTLGFFAIALMIYLRTLKINRPLKHIAKLAEQIGSGDFDIPVVDKSGIYEIRQLSNALEKMKISLKEYIANLSNVTKKMDKIRAEMVFASEVQQSLVPANAVPSLLGGRAHFYGILRSAKELGGDLYDYFMIDENHCCFGIADVEDKGLVAAMTMTMIITFIRTAVRHHPSPPVILKELNTFLCNQRQEAKMLTIMLGIIDIRDGSLVYSNCAHLPWFQRKANGEIIKHDRSHSTPLGYFPEIEIESDEVKLEKGDQLLLVTDGVTETMNDAGDYFESKGVEQVLHSLHDPEPEAIANVLLSKVNKFASSSHSPDDLTILVIRFD